MRERGMKIPFCNDLVAGNMRSQAHAMLSFAFIISSCILTLAFSIFDTSTIAVVDDTSTIIAVIGDASTIIAVIGDDGVACKQVPRIVGDARPWRRVNKCTFAYKLKTIIQEDKYTNAIYYEDEYRKRP